MTGVLNIPNKIWIFFLSFLFFLSLNLPPSPSLFFNAIFSLPLGKKNSKFKKIIKKIFKIAKKYILKAKNQLLLSEICYIFKLLDSGIFKIKIKKKNKT